MTTTDPALAALVALVSDGYSLEVVPLDLIGPDRVVLRVTARHGEPMDPVEVRVPSLRAVPEGLRELGRIMSGTEAGEDDTDVVRPAMDEARLGMMAAMFGMGDVGGATPRPSGERRPDTAAMAQAIFGTMRPARVAPAGDAGEVDSDPGSEAPVRQ